MTRVLPRTSLHSSRLIRCLTDLAVLDAAEPGSEFAEKLGHWVHFANAIALSSVHADGLASGPKMPAEARATACASVAADAERIHGILANAIMKSFAPASARSHGKLPAPLLELPFDAAGTFAAYRRFYESQQRDMELGLQPLRVNVREALAKATPKLRKLAELDLVFDKILREREGKLLARVPTLLRKRFDQLYKDHQQQLAADGQEDKPATWTQAGGWLARFCSDMQMLLLAELELRLQPVMGLIDAYKHDTQ